jgi:hypothetical protein
VLGEQTGRIFAGQPTHVIPAKAGIQLP